MVASKTFGVAFVCAVVLFAASMGHPLFGALTDADAQGSTPPETCTICHKGAGDQHQKSYDALYQDGVVKVTDLAYSYAAPNKTVITFKATKNGAPFNANDADNLAVGFAPYTGKSFEGSATLSLKGTIKCDATGSCTNTFTGTAPDLSATPGILALYGTDEVVGRLPERIQQGKYPFAATLETGGGVDYASAANASGCEKCHSTPYLKHGYIYGEVNGDPSTDFYICKTCHLDNGNGGHFEWQLLVDNPPLAADYLAGKVKLTPEQQAKYAYKTRLMNDVHMSHSMEFPY